MLKRPTPGDILQKCYDSSELPVRKVLARRDKPEEDLDWRDAGVVLKVEGNTCFFFNDERNTADKVVIKTSNGQLNRLWRIKPNSFATDPYGHLTFAIGSADDFYCFDFHLDKHSVQLHSVINSETGHFIQDGRKVIVGHEKAPSVAQSMVDEALDWCAENDIQHDEEGWNQPPEYFVTSLTAELERYK